jgi:addiction module HigA family antidote
MATMYNPPHPGETLREDVLPALGLSVTDAAAQLGVTRAALSRVLNGRAGISPEMSLRLERWLGVEPPMPRRRPQTTVYGFLPQWRTLSPRARTRCVRGASSVA